MSQKLRLLVCAVALAHAASGGEQLASVRGEDCPRLRGDVLDFECSKCTVSQVAQATSIYFREILEHLVQTPLFRLYTPYPDHPGRELFDVEFSLPEFQQLASELTDAQLGCAIRQCGCEEAECRAEKWRHRPCFAECEGGDGLQESPGLSTPEPVNDGEEPVQYDLVENPEQFTGYGTLMDDKSARMIWGNLYSDRICYTSCSDETESEVSVEKRLIFRVVSGLQASINTHIAMHYGFYTDTGEPATLANWRSARDLEFRPWKDLFDERVGKYPDRIRNMHFVFTLMARALHRLAPHLHRVLEVARGSCDKCAAEFNHTRQLLQHLLVPPDDAPDECSLVLHAFDYTALFKSDDVDAARLKHEFKARFERLGKLMTCVGCDRCKLWGTLQFHAARVAVGILIGNETSANGDAAESPFVINSWSDLKPNDVVALVNAMAQVSKSIDQAKEWMALDRSTRAEL